VIAGILNLIVHTNWYRKVKFLPPNKILNNSELLDLEDFN